MIGRLRGIIIEKQPPEILIEVNGVGYEVAMPMTSFYELPEKGEEATILTHFVVREDAQLLYGFNNQQERALFREIIKVGGFGAKLALAILSTMSAPQFIYAIEVNELNLLVNVPGVGKKTAERLIVEMRDRLKRLGTKSLTDNKDENAFPLTLRNNTEAEAISALVSLGYKPQEASKMIQRIYSADVDSETLIRDALKSAR